jgi:hypothetical protein
MNGFGDAIIGFGKQKAATDAVLSQQWRRAQWIDATLACSLAAGVLKP